MEKNDYEKPRSPKDLIAWVGYWQTQLQSNEALSKEFRNRTGLWRQFATEALPIRRFIRDRYETANDVTITLRSGSQAYDAELSVGGVAHYLEVTSTNDLVDAYQREYLNTHGVAPGDPVGIDHGADLQRARQNNFPHNPGQFVYGNSGQEEELAKVVDRIRAKLAHTNYPAQTILIVSAEETLLDLWKDHQILDWVMNRIGVSTPNPFSEIWLVLQDGRCLRVL